MMHPINCGSGEKEKGGKAQKLNLYNEIKGISLIGTLYKQIPLIPDPYEGSQYRGNG